MTHESHLNKFLGGYRKSDHTSLHFYLTPINSLKEVPDHLSITAVVAFVIPKEMEGKIVAIKNNRGGIFRVDMWRREKIL